MVTAPTQSLSRAGSRVRRSRWPAWLLLRLVVAEPEFDLVAVGKRHTTHEPEVGSVLRVISEHGHLLALPKARARDAGAARRRGAEARERPWRHFATRILHVKVDVNVRVHPLHFRHCPRECDWLVNVEFRRKRVMRKHRHARENRCDA